MSTTATQFDWIEQLLASTRPECLTAVDTALERFPEGTTGRGAGIRLSLLQHRGALLGQQHNGAAIPTDVQFKDGTTSAEILDIGGFGRYQAWAISDSFMEIAGGHGHTSAEARARAMVGLMLSINETYSERSTT